MLMVLFLFIVLAVEFIIITKLSSGGHDCTSGSNDDGSKKKRPTSSYINYDYERLAEGGHAASQYLTGNAYIDAYRGHVEDREEALKKAKYWYGKAMAQGYDLDPDARDIAMGRNPPSWW